VLGEASADDAAAAGVSATADVSVFEFFFDVVVVEMSSAGASTIA